jgi:magnesium chelatase family protein
VAKRGLEVAAAGGHSLLLVGPVGAGKTMLARCLPGLLPPLDEVEVAEVAVLYVRAGRLPPSQGRRPFRRPDPGIRLAELFGASRRPGEVGLAHRGVLLLDDLRGHRARVLRAVSQLLEDTAEGGSRSLRPFELRSRFQLIATARACPCGHRGGLPATPCICTRTELRRYWQPIAASLLDSFDLWIETPAPTVRELRNGPGEPSAEAARRVALARQAQADRFGEDPGRTLNAEMAPADLARHCALDPAGRALLEAATEKLGLSPRALEHVLRVARTIADLAGAGPCRAAHLAEAIQYRSLDVIPSRDTTSGKRRVL